MVRALTLPAPAKLNLFLHVTGRRRDGYHALETLFVPIDRGDIVSLAPRDDASVVRVQGPQGVEAEDDLALRAARLLQRSCDVARGVSIAIDKRVPIGGGLGGGSSDAATVLLGLNRLWDLRLSRAALMSLALELSADVPFFIFGEPAFARGIGELFEPLTLPPTWFVVLTPGVQVSTATIFAAAELTRNSRSARIALFPEGYGGNDLQTVTVARFPEVATCLEALEREAGTAGARMTGSGACVFAAFGAEDAARQALSRMPRGNAGFVARALNRHPLWSFLAP